MKDSIPNVSESKFVTSDLGAAATVCYAWWREESICLTEELIREREQRISSRLRGALADMRKSDLQSKNDHGPVLLVPVQQASLPSLENTLFDCEHVEEVGREK